MQQNYLDRRRGCFFGLFCGDALGQPVEFKSAGSFVPITDFIDGGPHNLLAGQWTDDGSMALALSESIGSKGWDLKDQITRYCDWFENGTYSVNGWCFDIGGTTRNSLYNFIESGDVMTAADPDPASSGNGSIMRLAPVPIAFHDLWTKENNQDFQRYAEESSATTHASEQCKSSCRYLAAVLAALINGESKDEVLSPSWRKLDWLVDYKPLHPLVANVVFKTTFKTKSPPEIKGSGWVIESLEAALWAFNKARSFDEAVLYAVNLGDDSDTTGAVCGQLAGAYWGEKGIPTKWLDNLAQKQMLEEALTLLKAGK